MSAALGSAGEAGACEPPSPASRGLPPEGEDPPLARTLGPLRGAAGTVSPTPGAPRRSESFRSPDSSSSASKDDSSSSRMISATSLAVRLILLRSFQELRTTALALRCLGEGGSSLDLSRTAAGRGGAAEHRHH